MSILNFCPDRLYDQITFCRRVGGEFRVLESWERIKLNSQKEGPLETLPVLTCKTLYFSPIKPLEYTNPTKVVPIVKLPSFWYEPY